MILVATTVVDERRHALHSRRKNRARGCITPVEQHDRIGCEITDCRTHQVVSDEGRLEKALEKTRMRTQGGEWISRRVDHGAEHAPADFGEAFVCQRADRGRVAAAAQHLPGLAARGGQGLRLERRLRDFDALACSRRSARPMRKVLKSSARGSHVVSSTAGSCLRRFM